MDEQGRASALANRYRTQEYAPFDMVVAAIKRNLVDIVPGAAKWIKKPENVRLGIPSLIKTVIPFVKNEKHAAGTVDSDKKVKKLQTLLNDYYSIAERHMPGGLELPNSDKAQKAAGKYTTKQTSTVQNRANHLK